MVFHGMLGKREKGTLEVLRVRTHEAPQACLEGKGDRDKETETETETETHRETKRETKRDIQRDKESRLKMDKNSGTTKSQTHS